MLRNKLENITLSETSILKIEKMKNNASSNRYF